MNQLQECEHMEEYLDLIDSLPPLSRNDPCFCGSGLKYKRCCLKINRNPNPTRVREEYFEIKIDALTQEESLNNFPDLAPEDERLLASLYHQLSKHPETIDSEKCEYFQKLNTLHAKNPDHPIILNHLAMGYEHLGHQEQVEKLTAEIYGKFPDYLFAKTAQANLYLRDGLHEKAHDVLDGAHTLKQLYPHRTVFHISEVKVFEEFMMRYFCSLRDYELAEFHLRILQEILEDDDEQLQRMQQLLIELKFLQRYRLGLSRLLSIAKKEDQLQKKEIVRLSEIKRSLMAS